MKYIKKLIKIIKNISYNSKHVKELEESNKVRNNTRTDFVVALNVEGKVQKNIIKTLICEGDGTSIQRKLTS